MITLFRGHPSNDLLPSREILAAATEVLGKPERDGDEDDAIRHPLTYGSDPGSSSVREEIATWVKSRAQTPTDISADCINLTNGASYGAATALTRCCPREYTRRAFAVTPTYYLINQIFIDAGFKGRISGIVETEKGLDLDGLESILKNDEEQAKTDEEKQKEKQKENNDDRDVVSKHPLLFKYVLYLVPVFSNPGGYTLDEEASKRLLAIARKYDMLLLCDQVYDYLSYNADFKLPKPLVQSDRESLPPRSFGNVIANCSFSKYLGPGSRVGWQECATPVLAHHLSQTGANKSGGSPSHMNTFIVAEMLRNGSINIILEKLRNVYGTRSKAYLDAMNKYLPKDTEISGGQGGYFFWLTFPPEYEVQAITQDCKSRDIVLAPGNHFEVIGDEKGWGNRCFRVSVSYHDVPEAVRAIKLWGEIASQHKKAN